MDLITPAPAAASAPAATAAALADALARGDAATAAAVMAEHLWPLVRSEWGLLARALEELPDEVIAGYPELSIAREFNRSLLLRGGAANRGVEPLVAPDADNGLPPMLMDALLLQELLGHRLRGDVPAARVVAERLRERGRRTDDAGRRPAHRLVGFHQLQIGVTEALAGDLDAALRHFGEALLLRDPADEDFTEGDALLKGALVNAALGHLAEAERLLERAATASPVGEPFASELAATRCVARALVAVERLAPDAGELVRAAHEGAADTELWPFALLASTRWSIVQGDLVGVLDEADRATASRAVPAESFAAAVIAAARGRALVLMGELAAAQRALRDGVPEHAWELEPARIRVALHVAGPEAAFAAARTTAVGPGVGPSVRAEALLLAAWAQLRRFGEVKRGTAGPVAALIRREGLWRVLQLVPDEVRAAIAGLESAPDFDRQLAVADPDPTVRLTPSELEILQLLAGPDSLPAIAAARFVTLNTVKTHVSSIYRRLGVNSRAAAVAEATRRGLLGAPRD